MAQGDSSVQGVSRNVTINNNIDDGVSTIASSESPTRKRDKARTLASRAKRKTQTIFKISIASDSENEDDEEAQSVLDDPAFNPAIVLDGSPGRSRKDESTTKEKLKAARTAIAHPRRTVWDKVTHTAAGKMSTVKRPFLTGDHDKNLLVTVILLRGQRRADRSRGQSSRACREGRRTSRQRQDRLGDWATWATSQGCARYAAQTSKGRVCGQGKWCALFWVLWYTEHLVGFVYFYIIYATLRNRYHPDIVRWQMDNHAGFVPAYYSSFADAPVRQQHERWRMIRASELRTGKVLLVLGKNDRAVFSDELEVDVPEVLGRENVRIKSFDAGHEVPITYATQIAEWIWEQWTAG